MRTGARSTIGRLGTAAAVLAVAAPLAASDPPAPGTGFGEASAAAPHTGDLDRAALARIEDPPLGLPAVPLPAHNPPTAAKIRLGRQLFFDRRLSSNGTMSCAMCHVPEQGFTNNELKRAVGIGGKSLPRNAPTLLNSAYAAPFFRDGREPDLDLQPFDVFLHPDEMAAPSLGAVVATVRSLPDYGPLFDEAFGGPATVASIGQGIGTYVRTLLSANSAFDRWYYGDDADALGAPARRGFRLFVGKAHCATCHPIGEHAATFTDNRFHDTGLGRHTSMVRRHSREPVRVEIAPGQYVEMDRATVEKVGDPPANDLGRYQVTGDPSHRWQFKTPTLRNVALTAPYMHDGSFLTLREVVGFYDRGGFPHPGIDPEIRPLGLTDGEISDLVAFLESLTGDNVDELVRDARSQRVGNVGTGRRPG